MSTLSDAPHSSSDGRYTATSAAARGPGRALRWAPMIVTVVVLGWSALELINLAVKHTTGPEIYGVLTAALATGAGVASVALLRSTRPQLLVVAAVLVLWAVIAIAGVAGSVAHIVGPVAGHGQVDLRPRPIAAPLIFTVLGVVGGATLFVGQRIRTKPAGESGKE
jgi:4-amino-4-deoxy-L-arabinose transferase-like glycosyltransferase